MKNLKVFTFLAFSILWGCREQAKTDPHEKVYLSEDKKEVLLIGTFHFNNPGADVAKTKSFDILKDDAQTELAFIASKIKEFKPSKIFVEWNYKEQIKLDSLYELYKEDKYFYNHSLNDFYKKNEIFQLAFRTAKLNGLNTVHGIDYKETEFPFDSLMTVISKNNQVKLQQKIENSIQKFTSDFDNEISKGTSLLDLLFYLNTPDFRQFSNEFHNEVPLLVGKEDNFIGPYLTSEWYKRNLYMWSLIQKKTNDDDQRIMVLLGASHSAIIKDFIDKNSKWKVTGLQSLFEL